VLLSTASDPFIPHHRRSLSSGCPHQAVPISDPTDTSPPPTVRDRISGGARGIAGPVIRGLVRIGATPNTVTTIGFLLVATSVPFIIREQWLWAFFFFTIGSISDLLDGSIARLTGKSSRFGAFLDSTLDRFAEGIVLGAVGISFGRNEQWWALAAAFTALTASFLISYTRARAEGLGIDSNKGGLMSRPERLFLLGAGFFFQYWIDNALAVVVSILAVLSLITVIQRVFHVWSVLKEDGAPD